MPVVSLIAYTPRSPGVEAQGGQHQAHVRPSADAAVPDRRPGRLRADVGVGPPAGRLHAAAAGYFCEGDALSLCAARQ